MDTKLKSRQLQSESPPINRQIYMFMTGGVSRTVRAVVALLSLVKIPAFFAVIATLIVSMAQPRTAGYFFSQGGAIELGAFFALYLVGFSLIFLVLKLLIVVIGLVFR